MLKTMRLYKIHDIDLISLYKNPNFKFNKNMKLALKAFINKEQIKIEVPEYKPINVNEILKPRLIGKRTSYFPYILIHLSLNEDTDKDIIELLDHIKPGRMNGFLKNILRSNLTYCNYSPYIEGEFLNKYNFNSTVSKSFINKEEIKKDKEKNDKENKKEYRKSNKDEEKKNIEKAMKKEVEIEESEIKENEKIIEDERKNALISIIDSPIDLETENIEDEKVGNSEVNEDFNGESNNESLMSAFDKMMDSF